MNIRRDECIYVDTKRLPQIEFDRTSRSHDFRQRIGPFQENIRLDKFNEFVANLLDQLKSETRSSYLFVGITQVHDSKHRALIFRQIQLNDLEQTDTSKTDRRVCAFDLLPGSAQVVDS